MQLCLVGPVDVGRGRPIDLVPGWPHGYHRGLIGFLLVKLLHDITPSLEHLGSCPCAGIEIFHDREYYSPF